MTGVMQTINAPVHGGVAGGDITHVGVTIHMPAVGPRAELLCLMPASCHPQLLQVVEDGSIALVDLVHACRNHALVSSHGQLVQRGVFMSVASAIALLLLALFPVYVSTVAWGPAWRWSPVEQAGLLLYSLVAALTPLGIFYFLAWPQVTAWRALQVLRSSTRRA